MLKLSFWVSKSFAVTLFVIYLNNANKRKDQRQNYDLFHPGASQINYPEETREK